MAVPAWVGPAITAGGSLLGGALSGSNQKKMFDRQLQAQKQFAQHGVRWKVADARAAGISPLVALGASTHSPGFSMTGSGLGDGVAQAAETMGRYVGNKHARKMQGMRAAKENLLLDAQINESNARAREHNASADFTQSQAFSSKVAMATQRLRSAADLQYSADDQPLPPRPVASSQTLNERDQASAPSRTAIPMGPFTYYTNPNWAPASALQEEAGEPGEWIYSIPKIIADLLYNIDVRKPDAPKIKGYTPRKMSKDAHLHKYRWENRHAVRP